MTASLCETATPGTAELLGWVAYIVTIISPGFFFSFYINIFVGIYKIKLLFSYLSGQARVLGYTVYRGFLNRVYGILQLKYGYSVLISLSLNFRCKVYLGIILGIFGRILGIFGYFCEFCSGILVYHYPHQPTLIFVLKANKIFLFNVPFCEEN